MQNSGWGEIKLIHHKRGRETELFLVKCDILQDANILEELTEHGVSKEDLEYSLSLKYDHAQDSHDSNRVRILI